MSLRPYQQKAIEEIREGFQSGKRKALLWLATGSGKSVIASEIIRGALSKNKKVVFVVKGISLVDQIAKRLEDVPHTVWQGNKKITEAALSICSIDTITRRKEYPEADLIFIDEADHCTSDGYRKFVDNYPNAYFISVTATPFVDLSHICDFVVHPITVKELTSQRFLSPLRYFAPTEPNLRGVEIMKGDYQNKELEKRMLLTGDILSHWLKFCKDRPTLCFAVNVKHSMILKEMFLAQGIQAEHMDARTPIVVREEAFKRLESGQTKVICNVGITTRGIDLPYVSCLILARPTKSYSLYIQMLGRGTRIHPGKVDTIVLDHAACVKEHGFMTTEPELNFKRKHIVRRFEVHICSLCFLAYQGANCPACGVHFSQVKNTDVNVKDGTLEEVSEDEIANFIRQHKQIAKLSGFKQGWVYFRTISRFGDKANPYLPFWFVKNVLSRKS